MSKSPKWLVDEINAAPDGLRRYIMELEANLSIADYVQQVFGLEESVKALNTKVAALLEPPEGIRCPFCGEDDFDQGGLKGHLVHDCEPYSQMPNTRRVFQ